MGSVEPQRVWEVAIASKQSWKLQLFREVAEGSVSPQKDRTTEQALQGKVASKRVPQQPESPTVPPKDLTADLRELMLSDGSLKRVMEVSGFQDSRTD